MKKYLFTSLLILWVVLFPASSWTWDYVLESPPSFTSMTPPELAMPVKGGYVTDPNTGTQIYRVTDWEWEISGVHHPPITNDPHYMFPVYSQTPALNRDSTLMLLKMNKPWWTVYDAVTFEKIKFLYDYTGANTNLNWGMRAGEENIIYWFKEKSKLYKIDITPCLVHPHTAAPIGPTLVHDFASDFPMHRFVDTDYYTYYDATGTAKNTHATILTNNDGTFFRSYGGNKGILIGKTILNVTDGSSGTITRIYEDTLTATLTGGALNIWTAGDTWKVINGQIGYDYIFMDDYHRPDPSGRYWGFFVYHATDALKIVRAAVYDLQDDVVTGSISIERLSELGGTTDLAGNASAFWPYHGHLQVDPIGLYAHVYDGENACAFYDFKRGGPLVPWIRVTPSALKSKFCAKHGDIAITKQGTPVWVANSGTGMMRMSDLATGKVWSLFQRPNDTNDGHGTGYMGAVKPGWLLYSSYNQTQTGYTNNNWDTDQLFMVELDETKALYWEDYSTGLSNPPDQTTGLTGNARVWRISHNLNYYPSGFDGGCVYNSQAWATIDKNGTKILWAPNWRDCSMASNGYKPPTLETLMITLPTNWYTDLGGTTCIYPSHWNGVECITCVGLEHWNPVTLICETCAEGTHWDGVACISDCVSPYFYSDIYHECILTCPSGQHWDVTVSPHACTDDVVLANVARREWMALTSYDLSGVTILPNFFTFLITSSSETEYDYVVANKAVMPDIKAIFYQDALTYGGTQYMVHDTLTDLHIRSLKYGWYLHDFSDANYRAALAAEVVAKLAFYPYFDGIFLDDVWSDPTTDTLLQDCPGWPTCDAANLPVSIATSTLWRANMTLLIQDIKNALNAAFIGSKLVIVNTVWARDEDYLAAADGMMDESFGHASWDEYDSYLPASSWVSHLNAFIAGQAAGKYYITQSGVQADADGDDVLDITQAQINAIAKYCYASFLLGVNVNNYGKHYFTPDVGTGLTYKDFYWYPIWQTNIGTPVLDYSQIVGKSSYKRVFTNGIVLVNPTDSAETVDLEGTYVNESGQEVSSYALGAREGVILTNRTTPGSLPLGGMGGVTISPP